MPVHHVMTEEVASQIPVPAVQQIDVPVPKPFVQREENFVEVPQVQLVKMPSPVPQVMMQEVLVPVVIPRQTLMIQRVQKTV